MKKNCTSNRIGTTARRGPGTRTAKALSLHAGNGKSRSIHVPSADLHSDSRWRPEATRNPLTTNASVLEDLAGALGQITPADHPRTFKLLQSSRHKLTRKLIEEACEVTVEAVKRDPAGVVRESADLLYHLVVLWFYIGIEPIEIWEENKRGRMPSASPRNEQRQPSPRPWPTSSIAERARRRRAATCQRSARPSVAPFSCGGTSASGQ